MKVLLVDDSRTARMQLKTALGESGWEVTEADSGAEALTILNSTNKFDVMVTDQNMPEISGTDMVTCLRGTANCINKDVKTIFLTSDSSGSLRKAASNLGASAFVLKPVNIAAFMRIIKKVLAEDNDE